MVTGKLEKDIIRLYDRNIVNLFSINQIAKLLNKKYPYVNKKVSELIEQRILNRIIVGKSHLCSLNLNNEMTIQYLSLIEIEKREKSKTQQIDEFITQNLLSITIHCVIRSKNRLFFIIENIKDRRKIERAFDKAIVVDKTEFLDLISEDRDLFNDHLIIYGYHKFYELLELELDEVKKIHSPLRY